MTKNRAHYSYVLPPGWVRVDLRGELPRQANEVMSILMAEVPPDQRTALKMGLRPRLVAALEAAAEGGAYDMVVPVPRGGVVGLSTMVLSPMRWPDGVGAVDALAALAASDSSAELKEVSELVALRIHSTVSRADDAQPSAVATAAGLTTTVPDVPTSVRVQYFIGDPERPDDWITVLFSMPGLDFEAGRQWVDAEVSLFDRIVSTLRFD